MTVCWMFIVLLGCKFLHTAQSQTTCACSEQQKTVCAPVSVPCPHIEPEKNGVQQKLTIKLQKNKNDIFTINCEREKGIDNCKAPDSMGGVRYEDKNNTFFITELAGSGIYSCVIEKMFPPAYGVYPGTSQFLALEEEGRICKSNCTILCDSHNPSHGFVWIWIVAVVLLVVYSVIVSIIAVNNWVKLRKTDSQSDYMNTKPRATRERRKKKKGVQTPMPRYF